MKLQPKSCEDCRFLYGDACVLQIEEAACWADGVGIRNDDEKEEKALEELIDKVKTLEKQVRALETQVAKQPRPIYRGISLNSKEPLIPIVEG